MEERCSQYEWEPRIRGHPNRMIAPQSECVALAVGDDQDRAGPPKDVCEIDQGR